MKAIVIINEQHHLLPQQKEILDANYDEWERFNVPAKGWTLTEMEAIAAELTRMQNDGTKIVFASPIPYL
ncbi:hypothetical protein D6833_08315, partial [Candidatus Parcubacteria bacterium]